MILLESPDGSGDRFAERALAFGIEPLLAQDFEHAKTLLARHGSAITSILIPTTITASELASQLKALRKVGRGSQLIFVSMGKPPTDPDRTLLRKAGLSVALWEPYDEGTLRFQLNRALGGDRDAHARSHPRVPTYLLARVFVADRVKEGVVYSLSLGGCFLETPRAIMDGARIEVELDVRGGTVRIPGRVAFCNVPGNLQRANLPLGMGVEFDPTAGEDGVRLGNFIAERLKALNV